MLFQDFYATSQLHAYIDDDELSKNRRASPTQKMSRWTQKRHIDTIDLVSDDNDDSPTFSSSGPSKRQARTTIPSSSSSGQRHRNGWEASLSQPSSRDRESWAVDSTQSEVNREIVELEDDESDYENYQLYGTLDTKIVGVQYYAGFVLQVYTFHFSYQVIDERPQENTWSSVVSPETSMIAMRFALTMSLGSRLVMCHEDR